MEKKTPILLDDLCGNVAICLFGHTRTFRRNVSLHLKLATQLGSEIYGHTWAMQDVADSWHSINSGIHTATREDLLRAVYGRTANFLIEEQNPEFNEVHFTDSLGRIGIVGHQFHMWQSILSAGEMALQNSQAEYLLFTRYDISMSVADVLKLPIKTDAWNSIARQAYIDSSSVIECYDLFFVLHRNVFLRLMRFRNFETFRELISDYYLLTELKNMGIPTYFNYELYNYIKIRRPVMGRLTKIIKKLLGNV